MKRLPVFATFLIFVALCVSISFWGLRLFKPQVRNVANTFQQNNYEPGTGQWGGLFGNSQVAQISASNYQLKGIILAKHADQSLAIISANGKPAVAVAMNKELAPGVVLKEVHDQYVMVSESGNMRRVELPQTPEIVHTPVQIAPLNQSMTVPPQVAPVAFPAPKHNEAPGGPVNNGGPPMVTPGLPTASLPGAMPGGQQ